MYTDADLARAEGRVKRYMLQMLAALAPVWAIYVLALVKRSYGLSVVMALLMIIILLPGIDLKLWPALRYRRFLKEMQAGLRRRTECVILRLDEEIQMQDGAHVRSLHVRLPDGDDRIFYLNAAKAEFLPQPGTNCTLVSYGRHIVEFSDN